MSSIVAPGLDTREFFQTGEARIDGREKVSGRASYTADFSRPGMLWAAFVKSPFAHARIRSISTGDARAVEGVRAVITGQDIGPKLFGRRLADWPILAVDKVRFIGDRIAAVAAETREAAEEAARLVSIDYDELPAIFDPLEALAPDAPLLHEHPDAYAYIGGERPQRAHGNIQGSRRQVKGERDLQPLFAASHRVFEHRFRTPRLHHGFIEPHALLVFIDASGTLHVHTPCKSPFWLRGQLAAVTGLAPEKIVIESSSIGGDFGGKGLVIEEFACYFLARETGRPIKAVMSYVDELGTTSHRHSAEIRLRTGVDAAGAFLVHEAEVTYDGGAYAGAKPTPFLVPSGSGFATVPYRVPHASIDVRSVYTNTLPAGHMRAPADVQTVFAWESHVDMMARELQIDPLELRLRNAVGPGDAALAGEAFRDVRSRDVLETLARESAWGQPLPIGHGRGMSFTSRHMGGGTTAVRLRLDAGGVVSIVSGIPDQGAGIGTVVQRVAAAALGVRLDRIAFRRGTTSEAPNDPGAGGSRSTHIVGRATERAARELHAKLEQATGAKLGDDRFVHPDGTSESFESVAARLCAVTPIELTGSYSSEHAEPGHAADYSFCAYAIEVAVDRETGTVRVVNACFVADVGTIINPTAHQGQIDGGFAFGFGSALTEEIVIEQGKVATLSLGDYKIPSIADVPQLRTILVQGSTGEGPFGAKAAGELSNTSVAPAIANAIAAACGARITTLPLTSERVYEALHPPR
jgi:CO/xanthine dehydrogenase Mo-binding subunit